MKEDILKIMGYVVPVIAVIVGLYFSQTRASKFIVSLGGAVMFMCFGLGKGFMAVGNYSSSDGYNSALLCGCIWVAVLSFGVWVGGNRSK
jgi:hypothetical protein